MVESAQFIKEYNAVVFDSSHCVPRAFF